MILPYHSGYAAGGRCQSVETASEFEKTKRFSLARVRALEARIADLERRLPAHSTPPSLVQELEDLEEQLSEAKRVSGSDS